MGLPRITQTFVAQHGLCVLDGPFAGMTYVPRAVGSAFIPKLLGSYECELHDILRQTVSHSPQTVVDIGCAEGYYAVGLARRMPSAHVYAFDTDPAGQRLCREMAAANCVADRVTVAGTCSLTRLNALLKAGTLLVCDCEGCEADLLRPDLVPGLAQTVVLAELHHWIVPSIAQTLAGRFEVTHDVCFVTSAVRNPAQYPALAFLPAADRATAVSEFRPAGQQWACFIPKCSRQTGKSA